MRDGTGGLKRLSARSDESAVMSNNLISTPADLTESYAEKLIHETKDAEYPVPDEKNPRLNDWRAYLIYWLSRESG